jgi:hypothetical protein
MSASSSREHAAPTRIRSPQDLLCRDRTCPNAGRLASAPATASRPCARTRPPHAALSQRRTNREPPRRPAADPKLDLLLDRQAHRGRRSPRPKAASPAPVVRRHGEPDMIGVIAEDHGAPEPSALQIRAVLSRDAVTTRAPSGLNIAERSASRWPRRTTGAPEPSALPIRAVESDEAVTTRVPPGSRLLNRTHRGMNGLGRPTSGPRGPAG